MQWFPHTLDPTPTQPPQLSVLDIQEFMLDISVTRFMI